MEKTLIILPAYNVEKELEKIIPHLSIYKPDVIFIDDASTDHSFSILQKNAFEIIRHKHNLGTSASLLTGIKYAQKKGYTSVILMDADAQHDPRYISQLKEELEYRDIILGNRFHSQTIAPEIKWNSNFFAAMLFNNAFGLRLTDVACGFRAFRIDNDLIDFLESKSCKKYDIVYLILIYFLMKKQSSIGTINMEAIYDYDKLMFTRQSELESLVNSIVGTLTIPDKSMQKLYKSIILKQNFCYIIKGIRFNAFYLKHFDGYIIQIPYQDFRRIKKILNCG